MLGYKRTPPARDIQRARPLDLPHMILRPQRRHVAGGADHRDRPYNAAADKFPRMRQEARQRRAPARTGSRHSEPVRRRPRTFFHAPRGQHERLYVCRTGAVATVRARRIDSHDHQLSDRRRSDVSRSEPDRRRPAGSSRIVDAPQPSAGVRLERSLEPASHLFARPRSRREGRQDGLRTSLRKLRSFRVAVGEFAQRAVAEHGARPSGRDLGDDPVSHRPERYRPTRARPHRSCRTTLAVVAPTDLHTTYDDRPLQPPPPTISA